MFKKLRAAEAALFNTTSDYSRGLGDSSPCVCGLLRGFVPWSGEGVVEFGLVDWPVPLGLFMSEEPAPRPVTVM